MHVFMSLVGLLLLPAAIISVENDYPIKPVPFNQVHLDDAFWSPRLETNRTVTVPTCFKKCEETRIPNFRKAAKMESGKFVGDPFDDSDVYKVAEGAAYCLSTHADQTLDTYLDNLIGLFAKAQLTDGYLYTARIIHPDKPPGRAGPKRFENEIGSRKLGDSHELYNAGHMIEAAVAHFQATGKRSFLDVAIKYADLIDQCWGPASTQLHIPPGHQEIELALVKLSRVTDNKKYLLLAKYLLDCRGHYQRTDTHHDEYYCNFPLIHITKAMGHAVRTTYMLSGMTDIAAILHDPGYTKAVDAVWADTIGSKLYLHGGVGAIAGHEGFGAAYELPNNGYNETCAAIAMCLWNHRMFLLHGDAQYIDVLERTLYNGFLSGVSLSGDEFFYPNPLESRGGYGRKKWFGCACCPVNICRFLPSMPGFVYAVNHDQVYVNLFVGGKADITVAGTPITIRQDTNYPWDGDVAITLTPKNPTPCTLHVRIPGWARNQPVPTDLYQYADHENPTVMLRVNGQEQKCDIVHGYMAITRTWTAGDKVHLSLSMPVRRVAAHTNVTVNQGHVALERGPLMYCVEGVDNHDEVFNLSIPNDAPFTVQHNAELLKGITVICAPGIARHPDTNQSATITAIPYYAWCNRGAGKMMVWLAQTPDKAELPKIIKK